MFLKFWKIPAVKTTLELLSTEAGARLSSQIAVLNSFLENFQGGLQAHLKKTSHGYVIGKFPKFLLRFVSRTNFITPINKLKIS